MARSAVTSLGDATKTVRTFNVLAMAVLEGNARVFDLLFPERRPSCKSSNLGAAPDVNRRAAVSRELYSFPSPVRAGELKTLGCTSTMRLAASRILPFLAWL